LRERAHSSSASYSSDDEAYTEACTGTTRLEKKLNSGYKRKAFFWMLGYVERRKACDIAAV